MTLEEILELSIEKIEAMSDQELTEHFKQYFPVTRPEQARVERQTKQERQVPAVYLSPQKQAALKELQESGVDISFLKRRFKR